jgi:hypothetical protein
MSTATLTPTADPDDFDRIVEHYNDQPRREPSRWVSEREAIAEGLGFRRHRTRERES